MNGIYLIECLYSYVVSKYSIELITKFEFFTHVMFRHLLVIFCFNALLYNAFKNILNCIYLKLGTIKNLKKKENSFFLYVKLKYYTTFIHK
jgi:hypothetical protein